MTDHLTEGVTEGTVPVVLEDGPPTGRCVRCDCGLEYDSKTSVDGTMHADLAYCITAQRHAANTRALKHQADHLRYTRQHQADVRQHQADTEELTRLRSIKDSGCI